MNHQEENITANSSGQASLDSHEKIFSPITFGALPNSSLKEEYLRLIKLDIEAAQANLDALPERDRRGLTLETLRHFHCGYLSDWVLTKSRAEYACGLYFKDDITREPKHLPPPSARLIIPTPSMNHFNAVATSSARMTMDKSYWKQHAGTMELFGDTAAFNADLIIIVEGELDAMSIWQASAGKVAVVAILGCGNWKSTLLPKLKSLLGKHLLILFDADSAGKKSAERLRTELAGHDHIVITKYIYDALPKEEQNYFGWKVDANSILQDKGDEYLKSLLGKIIVSAAPDFVKLEKEKEQWQQRVRENNNQPSPELSIPTPKTKKAPISGVIEGNFGDNADCKEIKLILNEYVHASDLTRNDWRDAGIILKRYGFSLDDFKKWSNDGDSRYDEDACEAIWRDFDTTAGATNKPLTIATLINLAKQFGYQPKRKRADRANVFDKFNTDRLQSMRKNITTDAEPIGISDSTSPKAKRQERADRMNNLMTTREVADFLDVSLSTVKNWRSRKLFGCYFFPADEKHGDTLYYKRERVEQLKSVYQFGILQNMYKLARLNPEATPPADFQKSDSSSRQDDFQKSRTSRTNDDFQKPSSSDEQTFGEELSFRHREFMILDEVADFFGVNRKTVEKWHERGKLKEDMLGHNGDLYFAIDNVLEFTPPKERKTKPDRADFHNDSRADERSVEDIIADIRDYQCDWKVNKKGERLYILPTYNNARTIFDNDPNLQNLIGYDEFQDAIVLLKKARWQKGLHVDSEWSDKDDAQLRLYLRKNYADFQAKQLVEDMVIEISQANTFNPVKDYFANLPQWDGVERVGKFFINYLRVEDTPYAREVTWNWFIGAIARIFHVGCRYQTALVLHGAQGVGKSYSIERLGGKWYLELTDNVDDSHAADAIKKGWLVEIKEMSAMRRAEINAVKAFIERGQETRRAAYDKRATTTYRHCVFAITVNDSEFLRDQTGNRRYMILHCRSKARDYIEEVSGESLSDDNVIDQIWAEAKAKYDSMFANGFNEAKLLLSRDTARQADELATQYLQDDGMAGEIKAFLDKKIPPQYIWQLLTREERRKFFADGRLILPDGLADLNKRRRARGGKEDDVQHDVNKISSWLDGVAGKNFVRHEVLKRGDNLVHEYHLYGSEFRQHICAAEINNECFGSDKRKSMYRISEILNQLEDWHLEKRLQSADSVYFDQRKPYYRDTDNVTDEETNAGDDNFHCVSRFAPNDASITFDEDDMPF